MKLRRKTLIVCDRVDKKGASRAQSNEDHTSSPSARPERRGRRYQTLPKDQAGRAKPGSLYYSFIHKLCCLSTRISYKLFLVAYTKIKKISIYPVKPVPLPQTRASIPI